MDKCYCFQPMLCALLLTLCIMTVLSFMLAYCKICHFHWHSSYNRMALFRDRKGKEYSSNVMDAEVATYKIQKVTIVKLAKIKPLQIFEDLE